MTAVTPKHTNALTVTRVKVCLFPRTRENNVWVVTTNDHTHILSATEDRPWHTPQNTHRTTFRVTPNHIHKAVPKALPTHNATAQRWRHENIMATDQGSHLSRTP